jgi:RNA polymerase sigma-70 factor (ECF subfamily)
MIEDNASRTGSTLLTVLRDFSDEAWSAFVARYGPRIYQWCRGWRLQEADAENVTQEVLIKLFRKFRDFRYERSRGSFRSWLKTVAHHTWQDFLDSRRRTTVGTGGSDALEALRAAPGREDLARTLEEEFDLELLQEAKVRVKLEVSDRDWQIFQDLALRGQPGGEVARKLGMNVAAVFMVRSRVQEKLRAAVAALDQASSPTS